MSAHSGLSAAASPGENHAFASCCQRQQGENRAESLSARLCCFSLNTLLLLSMDLWLTNTRAIASAHVKAWMETCTDWLLECCLELPVLGNVCVLFHYVLLSLPTWRNRSSGASPSTRCLYKVKGLCKCKFLQTTAALRLNVYYFNAPTICIMFVLHVYDRHVRRRRAGGRDCRQASDRCSSLCFNICN